jgi:hypothetical protein
MNNPGGVIGLSGAVGMPLPERMVNEVARLLPFGQDRLDAHLAQYGVGLRTGSGRRATQSLGCLRKHGRESA